METTYFYQHSSFAALLLFDDAYPTVLNGKKSNGDNVQLPLCPEDEDVIPINFDENQVGLHHQLVIHMYHTSIQYLCFLDIEAGFNAMYKICFYKGIGPNSYFD